MTNFLQVTDNAKTRIPNGALNNTSNSVLISGIDTRTFDVVTTGYYVTIWDDTTYADPSDDPSMEKALVTDISIAQNGSIQLARTGPIAHGGTPLLALLVMARHVSDLDDAVNALELEIIDKADTADLSTVAFSGSYPDLINKPSIPTQYTDAQAAAAAPVQSVAGRTGAVTLSKTDVGLSNVDNVSDVNKPVSTAQSAALALKAATTYVDSQDAAEASARSSADATLTTAVAGKYTKPGTGIPRTDLDSSTQTSLGKADTALQTAPVNSVAGKTGTVTLVESDIANLTADLALKAPLASPALTGVPTAPTATPGTANTQLSTTDFVASTIKAQFVQTFRVAAYGTPLGVLAYAFCANATANEVEINNAIIAANALTGGGIVELIGTGFVVSAPIRPLPNVWLRGLGIDQTKVGITSTANNHIIAINRTTYNETNPITNFVLSDMELDASNMNRAQSSKCLDGTALKRCLIERVFAHDSTATGLGADDFGGTIINRCFVENCGYVNKRTVTAASWAASEFSYTTSAAHGYSVGDVIVLTGMVPAYYNGRYVISTTPTTTTFTINSSNNSGALNLSIDPGAATTLGYSSDSLIGHNGIGIASGQLSTEATIVSNCVVTGSQNNNFLIEADTNFTGANASYMFNSCISYNAGQNGFLNTGTPNTQFNDCYDYGSNSSFQMSSTSQTRTITAASWSGGVATFTTSTAHGYSASGGADGVPKKAEISGMTPSGYNGYYTVTGTPTTTTFTVSIAADPGAATVFGTSSYAFHNVYNSSINDCISSHALNWGVRLPTHSDGVMVKDTTIAYSYNYGIQFNSSGSQFSGLRIHDSGRQGIYISSPNSNVVPLAHNDISDSFIWNNGTRGVVSGGNGIEISPGTGVPISYLTINNVQTWDDQDTPTQSYGVVIRNGGSLSNISISGGNLTGATSGYLNQDTTDAVTVNGVGSINPNVRKALGSVTGTVTFDCTLANYFTVTLGGNITAVMPSTNVVPGSIMTWVITQDATGSRTIGLPANATAAQTANTFTLSTQANAVDTIVWAYDGATSKWREVGRALRTTAQTIRDGLTSIAGSASNIVPLTVTQSDTTNNPDCFDITNSGTGIGQRINQNGVLAASKYALFVDTSAAQVTSPLVRFRSSNASSTQPVLQLDSSGTGASLNIPTGGVNFATPGNTTGSAMTTTAAQTVTNKDMTSGTNTWPTFNQNTTGSAAKLTTARNIGGVAFDGTAAISLTSGSGIQKGDGSGGLTAAAAGVDYLAFSGTAKISVGTVTPASPATGDIWIDTN